MNDPNTELLTPGAGGGGAVAEPFVRPAGS